MPQSQMPQGHDASVSRTGSSVVDLPSCAATCSAPHAAACHIAPRSTLRGRVAAGPTGEAWPDLVWPLGLRQVNARMPRHPGIVRGDRSPTWQPAHLAEHVPERQVGLVPHLLSGGRRRRVDHEAEDVRVRGDPVVWEGECG